jgi:hypothetical protein
MTRLITFILLYTMLSCSNNDQTKTGPRVTKPVENITATADQSERRAKSEAYCKYHQIPVYSHALFVDPENEVTIRTKDAVVDRALALCYIGLKSEGLEQTYLNKIDKDLGISSKLSPNEKAYATATQPTEQQKIDANWRYEGLHVMLWALGFIDTLSYPDQLCNVADDVKIIHELGGKQFREKAKLRSKKEILDQADLILRLNWACVDARVKNKTAPGGLDKGVVLERHHALNWLISFLQQEWDDVRTDT